MFGTMAVKHMAMDENKNPTKKATSGTSKNKGEETKPAAVMTAKTMEELIRLFVAPHIISPVMTSSMFTGVATMASKVFWKYIRTKEA